MKADFAGDLASQIDWVECDRASQETADELGINIRSVYRMYPYTIPFVFKRDGQNFDIYLEFHGKKLIRLVIRTEKFSERIDGTFSREEKLKMAEAAANAVEPFIERVMQCH